MGEAGDGGGGGGGEGKKKEKGKGRRGIDSSDICFPVDVFSHLIHLYCFFCLKI